jgi:hypothetical protein
MGRACSTYGDSRGAYRVLVRNSKGRRPLGRVRGRWKMISKLILENWDGGYGLD